MQDTITHWFEIGGIAAVFLMMVNERFLPLPPSYLALTLVGIAAGDGALDLPSAIAASVGGSFTGAWLWYVIGRRIGSDRMERFLLGAGRWMGITHKRYQRVNDWMIDEGPMAMAVCQLIPTLRVFATFPAGVFELRFRRIAFWTFGGIAAWNTSLVLAGYAAGQDALGMGAGNIALIAGLLVLEGGFFWVLYQLVRTRRRLRADRRHL
jgi:membrane protein DedA with SNARE-associated domain